MVEYSGKIVNNTKIKLVTLKQIVLNIYLINQAYEADWKSDNKLLNKKNKDW